MGLTNVFFNSYEQPENKLTDNFLCLLEHMPQHRLFRWQVKYGAFGVSVSLLDKTIQYIKNQDEHHRKMNFKEEFLALLKKHHIAYDERYLWE